MGLSSGGVTTSRVGWGDLDTAATFWGWRRSHGILQLEWEKKNQCPVAQKDLENKICVLWHRRVWRRNSGVICSDSAPVVVTNLLGVAAFLPLLVVPISLQKMSFSLWKTKVPQQG